MLSPISRGLLSERNNLKTEIEDLEVKLNVLKKYREVKHYGEELKVLSGRDEKKHHKEYASYISLLNLSSARDRAF